MTHEIPDSLRDVIAAWHMPDAFPVTGPVDGCWMLRNPADDDPGRRWIVMAPCPSRSSGWIGWYAVRLRCPCGAGFTPAAWERFRAIHELLR